MLYNFNPLLSPELLHILRSMGHGDQIVIVDANFPADSHAQRLVRLDGASATQVLEAIVSLLPLDTYVEAPVHTMQVVGDPTAVPEIVSEFYQIASNGPGGEVAHQSIERFAFYEQVKSAYAVVVTNETRLYGNVILTKGVIG
ncbi:RbsD/FucU family protein [Parashewanella tropica]|uniref:RbsD/FucU family protein n=1 Tax=Parashewanella tropica TaxID=2547970 RepID=UPI001059C4A2|nr:RbsD/FucU domain-containing protein [Parashewanella tropica]